MVLNKLYGGNILAFYVDAFSIFGKCYSAIFSFDEDVGDINVPLGGIGRYIGIRTKETAYLVSIPQADNDP